jgi:hypothetical protein
VGEEVGAGDGYGVGVNVGGVGYGVSKSLSVSLSACTAWFTPLHWVSIFSYALFERSRSVGANDGTAAGQSVFHLHIHLFPRRMGDIENPRGGVRGVIPSKQKYVKK